MANKILLRYCMTCQKTCGCKNIDDSLTCLGCDSDNKCVLQKVVPSPQNMTTTFCNDCVKVRIEKKALRSKNQSTPLTL